MQSIQTMPAMCVTNGDYITADRPSFKEGLEKGLRDATYSEKIQKTGRSLLAKELNQPPLAEREKAYYDLHGVADVVEERPEFVDQCLADLESEICKLEGYKNAYEMAKKVNPEYICGRGFRLKFLRAERFMPKNAATRLVSFLEEKLRLFGPTALARELLLSDLNQDDMVLLRSGFFSIVPLRDSAGRVVTVIIPFLGRKSMLEIRMMRASMYLLSVLAQDEETQRKGCVGILLNTNRHVRQPVEPADGFNLLTNLMGNLGPLRYVGYHFCNENPKQNGMSNLGSVVSAAPQFIRLRFRFHSGSLTDINHDLMTFGIPTKVLPVADQGEAAWQLHYKWISSRESIEANNIELEMEQKTPSDETIKDDCITALQPMDVLMGRERLSQSHTGTTRYQCLIDEYRERYDMCEKAIDKTILASAIVMKVKEYGGRFLLRKKGETNWSEADDWAAREKVTNAFRGRRKSAAKRLKRINEDDAFYSVMNKKKKMAIGSIIHAVERRGEASIKKFCIRDFPCFFGEGAEVSKGISRGTTWDDASVMSV